MYLYFNRCRVCGQAHGVGEPHKFGKAADVSRRSAPLSAEAVETLADAMFADEANSVLPSPEKRRMTNAEKQRAYRERQRALAGR